LALGWDKLAFHTVLNPWW